MMERRVTRRKEFEITLEIKQDDFISPPDRSQKNWIISKAIDELADNLEHLDKISKRFVMGSRRREMQEEWSKSQAQYDNSQLIIDGQQVMQNWERPYMEAMAKIATETHGDILEIGFGMGISSTYIQNFGVKSHTIIECNEDVKKQFEIWKTSFPGKDIKLVFGKWQDVVDSLGEYDSIFFDTYPLSEEEYFNYVIEDVTFAAHFFETAARHLRKGGIFTYYSNEIDSVSRSHQRKLLNHFGSVIISVIQPLFPPDDCNYWWANSIVLIKAVK